MSIRLSDIPDIDATGKTELMPKKGIRLSDVSDLQPKPTFMQAAKRNLSPEGLAETGKELYSELIAPIAHGASTFAGGLPKMVAKEEAARNQVPEMIFPEQKTPIGKLIRGGAETLGFTAGAPGRLASFTGRAIGKGAGMLPKFAGKALAQRVLQGAGAGAVGMGAAGDTLENRKELAQMGATIGGAIPIAGVSAKQVGGLITKSGRWLAKNIGGVTDATVDIIKKLGADKVFDPLKAKADYIGSNIVPRMRQRAIDLATNVSKKTESVLKAMGISTEDINSLKSIDKDKLNKLKGAFDNDLEVGLNAIKDNADLQFKAILEKQPSNTLVDIKRTFYKLKKELVDKGWIDQAGNEKIGAGISNKTKSNLIKIFKDLKGFTGQTKSGKPYTGVSKINITDYFNKLSELEATIVGDPKFDRLVFEVQSSLRDDAARVIEGLSKANKSYSDASKLLELKPIFDKLNDKVGWEKQLLQLKDPRKAQLHDKYKNILGKDLYDDVLAHLANQDFEMVNTLPGAGGGLSVTRGNIAKTSVAGVAKKYYKDIAPKVGQIKKFTGRAFERGKGLVRELQR